MCPGSHRAPNGLVNKPTAQIPNKQLEKNLLTYMLSGSLRPIWLAGCKSTDHAKPLDWTSMVIASTCIMSQLT